MSGVSEKKVSLWQRIPSTGSLPLYFPDRTRFVGEPMAKSPNAGTLNGGNY